MPVYGGCYAGTRVGFLRAVGDRRLQTATTILATLSSRDREAMVQFYLKERRPEEICVELKLAQRDFERLRALARARYRELSRS